MAYPPIELGASVPPIILALVRDRVQPMLHDVRVMLSHPQQANDAGFNLSAAIILSTVVGGLARVFYSAEVRDGVSFRAAAARYPLSDEPTDAVRDPQTFADTLYETYRCNLVHSLGLTVDKLDGRWQIIPQQTPVKVLRRGPLSEQRLREVDTASGRPPWLEATLQLRNDRTLLLSPDALYWGIRRLVRTLAEDPSLQASALQFLRSWQVSPGSSNEVTSSAAPVVKLTQPPSAVQATAGPLRSESMRTDTPSDDSEE